MLIVKFTQLEDVKAGCRDMLAYQKHFYPLQMQAMLTENMKHCKAAAEDK
jgi:hypothetical protein